MRSLSHTLVSVLAAAVVVVATALLSVALRAARRAPRTT
jgi:hypothetical protein